MRRRGTWAVLAAALVAGIVALVLLVLPDRDQTETTGARPEPVPSTTPTPSPSEPRPPPALSEPRVTLKAMKQPSATREPSAAVAATDHAFPVGGCEVQYAAAHHDYPAADIFAGPECSFVSPVDGVVDEIGTTDDWDPSVNEGSTRGGLFVSVVGEDGVRYYGSHLSAAAAGIGPGVTVQAGETLGRLGDTGSARGTGTHLHFGISWPTPTGYWWIRRGVVAPQPYLDSWRQGGDASPVDAVEGARRAYGDDATCRAYC